MAQHTISGRTAAAIASSVERGVRQERLRPGDRLPPIRALAKRLGVSPVTVASAYRRLRERNLATGSSGAGTRVADRPSIPFRPASPVPEGVRDLADGNPDARLLPRVRALRPAATLYGAESKSRELVALTSAELRADGVATGALAVVGGALDGIERVLGAHLRLGDRVAVEDPCFTRVLDLIAAMGLEPEAVAIDERGPLPEALARALERGVDALVLTPRAQNPTGAALDERRAAELRRVVAGVAPDLLVIEDDHAGPIAGAPAVSLSHGVRRWAVIRSFAKALGPDLRVAVLAGDEETVARVEGRQLLGTGWVSHALQRAVAGTLSHPATPELLARSASAYAERRDALVGALREQGLRATGRSGLNVWVTVPEESAVVQALAATGWAVAAGERFRLAAPPAIRITVARLLPAEAPRLAAAVVRAVGGGARRSTA